MQKEFEFDFKRVLFLGVGGVSMCQLALAFQDLGCEVIGYDDKVSNNVLRCEQCGIKVYHKPNKSMLNVDLCVKTAGIKDNSKHVQFLKRNGIKIIDRAVALSWLCSKFKTVIAVAGTHGKTTTCALIYEILKKAGKRVSCHIGGEIGGERFCVGDDFLVVEACEYNKSFLKLNPDICIVTNIEKEHMDCYGNIFNLRYNFIKFLKKGKKSYIFNEKTTKFLKKYNNFNFVSRTCFKLNPKIKGEYNLNNISIAVAVCLDLGVEKSKIIKAVNSFEGVKRRCEYLGEYDNKKIFTDYAHHPTELREFLKSFKEQNGDVQIIFQPHTYSRTRIFFNEFVDILKEEKDVCLFKEYPAREKSWQGKSAKDLFLALKEIKNDVFYCCNSKRVEECLKNVSAVAFVGAGDIDQLARNLVQNKL